MLQKAHCRPILMESISERVWHISSLHNGNMKNTDDYVYGKTHLDTSSTEEGRDWKLMIDPHIKGKQYSKVVRYGGLMEGPGQLPITLRDPRDQLSRRQKEITLKVTKFKFDKWSVGAPPLKSIFIYGLNDNVNEDFLTSLCTPCGKVEQLKVYYHPKSRKHLGIAYASFASSSSAKLVVARFHGTSIMGNVVCFRPDPLGQITKKVLDVLIRNPSTNIAEIIQQVQQKSQHKTAAYAFRTNERSINYYEARGKIRRASDTSPQVVKPKTDAVQANVNKAEIKPRTETTTPPPKSPLSSKNVSQAKMEHISPKVEQISPNPEKQPKLESNEECEGRPTVDTSVTENGISSTPRMDNCYLKPSKSKGGYDDIYKQYKAGRGGTPEPDQLSIKEEESEVYDLKERKKVHNDRLYEEWKIQSELKIRAEKKARYLKDHSRSVQYKDYFSSHSERYYKDKYYSDKYYHKDKYHDDKYHDEKYRCKYDKPYDKYGKYYDYHSYGKDLERSSSKQLYEKLYKIQKANKEYASFDPREAWERSPSRDKYDSLKSPSISELDRQKRHSSLLRGDERSASKSRRDDIFLLERESKRKRSRSPDYHRTSPHIEQRKFSPKLQTENPGSATSHDTGYNSLSPVPVSPHCKSPHSKSPHSKASFSKTEFINPYGCARVIPRHDIKKLKAIGLASSSGSLSSSPMSIEESDNEQAVTVEDISPNTTPIHQKEEVQYMPPPLPIIIPPPLLPIAPPPLLPLPYPPQAMESWPDYNKHPSDYHYTQYNEIYQVAKEEPAHELARREAEAEANARQKEKDRVTARRSRALALFLDLMDTVLGKDTKRTIVEKNAFAQLEVVWNEEEDKKKEEEEKEIASQITYGDDQMQDEAPDIPSLSEMRTLSDAKSDTHTRRDVSSSLASYRVPKLNRCSGMKQELGMRAQVIVKKLVIERKSEEQSASDEEDEELICKRRVTESAYQKIYSSSSSSDSEFEMQELPVMKRVEKAEPAPVPDRYTPRTEEEEELIAEQLFRDTLSDEDKLFFKLAYDRLLSDGEPLLQGIPWLTPSDIPKSPRRRCLSTEHTTGCARSEGFYRVTAQDKMAARSAVTKTSVATKGSECSSLNKTGGQTAARKVRNNQRRQATHFYEISFTQYNQLQTRKKQVKFSRSDIHDWGLFTNEMISADEMVIEYVGEVVRSIIADSRERRYIEQGIGSSYLFRVDNSYVVDATHRGSCSRFINHNCEPNCYARVISLGKLKKIVIYSKRDIPANEEVTYDYKFPIEEAENKIPCLCNAPNCRGFLN